MSTRNQNDNELWQLVKEGDREAFALLYRSYMRVLYAAIYKWTENSSDAEDILQEVFLDLWEKRQQINIEKNPFNYLYSITRFKVFDHIRKNKLKSKHLGAWEKAEDHLHIEPGSTGSSPDHHGSILDKQFEEFPSQLKLVYHLRFREEKSIAEISAQMNLSTSTVKNHLQRIRKRLQDAIIRFTSLCISSLFMLLH